MSQYSIIQDMDRCIGCLSCEVYCKENKQLPEGPRLCQIAMLGRRVMRGLPREAYVYLGCFHCQNAACVAACPTRAIKKRESDGMVLWSRSFAWAAKPASWPVPGGRRSGTRPPKRPSNAICARIASTRA